MMFPQCSEHQRMIAVVNALTVAQAKRSIYTPTPEFIYRLPDGRLGNARETIEFLATLKSKKA
jgi:hypothetical protein